MANELEPTPRVGSPRPDVTYTMGKASAGLLQPLAYGVLVVGPGIQVLPWGHGGALALIAFLAAIAVGKVISDRFAPALFATLAVGAAAYPLLDLPRAGFAAGIAVVVIVWGATGSRGRWARCLALLPTAVIVATWFGFGDSTALRGASPTLGHAVEELVRIGLLLLLSASSSMLRQELVKAKAETETAVKEAAEAERARIARELHDVVSHHVTVMVLQAEGARSASAEPVVTKALSQVVTTGRTALNELRRLLGVLRQPDEGTSEPELEPQPDLDQLPNLIEQLRGAGLNVDLQVIGEPSAVEPGVGLSAYRIVQEALTNTLRHSGGEAAHIRLHYADDAITVDVSDHGGTRRRLREGSGTGLVGMQERAAAVGGTVEAGPVDGGGYSVRARLPRG